MQIIGLVAAEGGGAILIPHAADLIWGSVSFVILLILFSKYVLPRFNKVLAERAEKIEGGFKRAEEAQAEAEEVRQQSELRSRESMAASFAQAESVLQKEVGALALELASKVVNDSLQNDARARAVVDAFIADLERQASEAGR